MLIILIKVNATINRKQFDKSKEKFIMEYIDYNPQVKLPEIIEIGSHWQALIAAVCDIIDNVDTVVGSLLAMKLDDSRKYCQFVPTLADNMIALYEEIYSFQFDLIDSMAAYMRASTSLDAAKEINNEFEEVTKLNVNSGTTLTVLQMIGGLSYVTYHTHLLQTVNLYCNVLEYMKGGEKQAECKGTKTDVALLIANIEPVCISETYKYYSIPTWNSTNDDTAYIDIAQLFSGLKVIFKIPNAQWLLDHNWIHENEKDLALYVKKFDVFLPVKPMKPKEFYVISDPVLHNVVVPGSKSTEYIIVPHTHLIHEYSMGPRRTPCSQPKVQNPYTSCNREDISELCHYSSTAKSHLYPSIYSQWSLSVVGGEGFTIPKPATDLSIVVGIQICKIEQGGNYNQHAQSQDTSECCGECHYRPNMTSSCTPCPRGSKSSLDGYYCEKEDDAMFMNT